MTSRLLRWLVAGVFMLHGLSMGVVAAWMPFDQKGGRIDASWLLGKGGIAITIGVFVWVVAATGYLVASVYLARDVESWRLWAWAGAIATVLSIALWVGALPTLFYAGGAIAATTIVYLLVWRPDVTR